jgi:hypothetical protein
MENKLNTSGPNNTLELKVNIGFLSSRFAGSGSFALALLLFFLPFINFKCGDVKIGHVTGVQAALHLNPTVNENMYKDMLGPLKNLDKFGEPEDSPIRKKKAAKENNEFGEVMQKFGSETGASICLPIAFFLGIIGAILLLLKKPWAAMGGVFAGWFAVGLMVFSAIMIISKVKKGMSGAMGGMGGLGMDSFGISIGPTLWYYIAIVFLALAALLAQRLYHAYRADEQLRMEEEVMAQYPIATQPTEDQTDVQM